MIALVKVHWDSKRGLELTWERKDQIRWGYCDNHDLSRLDNQSIERDRLIGIGFVLDIVEFISFTFGDKEMISDIEIIDISSDSSDDRRWAAKKASAPVFYGPSTQGLLDAYGYNTIEEYLSWNYFPSTDNESTNMETTDKGNTDKDCIDDSNSAMSKGKYVPVCKKHNPNMYSPVPVTGCVLGLASVTTWDEIEKKMGARKSKTCADKAKGKRKVSCGS
ncbi:hypothetical protein Tco_0655623 [Tanacetum coccineum]|uniref:Uncharacterized protein n=1 Tax=Tanacetum coccineum TaxID=301880 RepID=A0ABQ4X6I0_9ASTR